MNLTNFPSRRYTSGRTPIEKLSRLSAELNGPTIYMKQDDLLGLAGGGNKTRKLKFVVADALAKKADTLITCGAVQSNHCRLTLAAAVKEGLKCRLVLEEHVPGSYNPDASGSAGTHAGLASGFYANNSNIPVTGVNVSRKKDAQESIVHKLAEQVLDLAHIRKKMPRDIISCVDDYVGPGYSLPTAEMVQAVKLTAQLEGIFLDPVYTGKAMAGLIGLVRLGSFKSEIRKEPHYFS